jgi:hypothetical protein
MLTLVIGLAAVVRPCRGGPRFAVTAWSSRARRRSRWSALSSGGSRAFSSPLSTRHCSGWCGGASRAPRWRRLRTGLAAAALPLILVSPSRGRRIGRTRLLVDYGLFLAATLP